MQKRSVIGLALAVFLGVGLLQFGSQSSLYSAGPQHWSETNPPINIRHVCHGEINRRGKPVGFHSTAVQPKNAKVNRIRSKPNKYGIYVAEVAIRRNTRASWQTKTSSMFPDKMSQKAVTAAILRAYNNSKKGQKFRGRSGLGFSIEGYLTRDRKRINTAYPIYVRDR